MQLDWIGELANQIMGPVSIRLAAHDLQLDFSPPISVMGERMRHLASTGQTFRADREFGERTRRMCWTDAGRHPRDSGHSPQARGLEMVWVRSGPTETIEIGTLI